jgi:hypothetical protein
VPLILQEQTAVSNLKIPRSPAGDIYNQIVQDFTDALAVLPIKYDENNVGRATRGAALGMLAKAHLFQRDFAGVIARTEELFALGIYELNEQYTDNFALDKENGNESVFEIQYRESNLGWGGDTRDGHSLSTLSAPAGIGSNFSFGGYGMHYPSTQLVRAFEPGDIRRRAQILAPGETHIGYIQTSASTGSGYTCIKWWNEPIPNNESPLNQPYLRFAEVLLNYAEALNELSHTEQALIEINKVRNRAGLPALSGLDTQQTLDAIFAERRVEFVWEFNFWYDLVRAGRAAEFLQKEYGRKLQPHQTLFPIPQRELDLNSNLIQNPGY